MKTIPDNAPDIIQHLADYNPSVFGLLLKGLPAKGHFEPADSIRFEGHWAIVGHLHDVEIRLDVDHGHVAAMLDGERYYANSSLSRFYRCAEAAEDYLHRDYDGMTKLERRQVRRDFRCRLEVAERGCSSLYSFWGVQFRRVTAMTL